MYRHKPRTRSHGIQRERQRSLLVSGHVAQNPLRGFRQQGQASGRSGYERHTGRKTKRHEEDYNIIDRKTAGSGANQGGYRKNTGVDYILAKTKRWSKSNRSLE